MQATRSRDYFRKKASSGARLGDLLHFGQLFKASGNNYFVQTAHI